MLVLYIAEYLLYDILKRNDSAGSTKLVYYYGTTINPSIMWVDLNDFQLTPGSPIMKLDIMNAKRPYYGNVKADMTRSNGFKPLFRY